MSEHRTVQRGEFLARLDPEAVDEHLARLPVGGQRVGLAPAAVQREHQLRMQALAQRVLAA